MILERFLKAISYLFSVQTKPRRIKMARKNKETKPEQQPVQQPEQQPVQPEAAASDVKE